MRTAVRVVLALSALGISLLVVALVSLNKDFVRLQLGVADLPEASVGLLVACALATGAVVGTLFGATFALRSRQRARKLERQVGELENEIRDLRALPLRGDG